MSPVRRVLVAVDGSENSRRAVTMAGELCGKFGAELIVLHVVPQPSYLFAVAGIPPTSLRDYYEQARTEGEKWVSQAITDVEKFKISAKSEILEGAPSIVEAITTYAENNGVDLIVVGTKGLSGFKKLVLGSVASGVVSHANCSVLVVK
ncbi:MAG: universal stress protein [Nitrososphaerota archaeon]